MKKNILTNRDVVLTINFKNAMDRTCEKLGYFTNKIEEGTNIKGRGFSEKQVCIVNPRTGGFCSSL